MNALAAADTTLIPVQAQYLSAKGLEQLLQTVQKVRRQINPKLKIEGHPADHDRQPHQLWTADRQSDSGCLRQQDQRCSTRPFPGLSVLRRISAVGKSIFQHDPKGKVAEAYKSLTKEVMANAENSLNVSLKGADDIFSTEESRQEQQREQVQQIPIGELFPFKNHPFKVLDDESMQRTVESVEQYGVLSPLIARPRPEGGYEIISGHRRQHAAQLAGLDALPVIVRQMDDDAAVLLMVDSESPT